VTYLRIRPANLGCCDIVRTLQRKARFWIRGRYLDNDLLCARGFSPNIRGSAIPMKIGFGVGPLILGLESATDLQTLNQTGPTS